MSDHRSSEDTGELAEWVAEGRRLAALAGPADDEYAKRELNETGLLEDDVPRPDLAALDVVRLAARWRAARSLLALRSRVDEIAPNRDRRSDGTIGDAAHASRDSDHNPWIVDGGVGVVSALDITHDPAGGCDNDELVTRLVASRDARIKYVIWNRRICNSSQIGGASPWTWRPYGGANPHTRHFHLSVKARKALYDDAGPWQV